MERAAPDDQHAAVTATLRAAGCVFAEDEATLLIEAAGAEPERLASMLADRVTGRPLEHLLGWAEFLGRRLRVTDGVFVPRRRTETLVRRALTVLVESALPMPVVVDLCCGCGAIGAALAERVPGIELHACDISPVAVECARDNLGSAGTVYVGDLFAALPNALAGRVDLLVANAPYVPSDAVAWMPSEARDHEPVVALDGGSDGLDLMRRIAADAPIWLASTGRLLIETSMEQSAAAGQIFTAAGLRFELVHADDVDGTVIVGWIPAR